MIITAVTDYKYKINYTGYENVKLSLFKLFQFCINFTHSDSPAHFLWAARASVQHWGAGAGPSSLYRRRSYKLLWVTSSTGVLHWAVRNCRCRRVPNPCGTLWKRHRRLSPAPTLFLKKLPKYVARKCARNGQELTTESKIFYSAQGKVQKKRKKN